MVIALLCSPLANAAPASTCAPLPGFAATDSAQVVVFGDLHGTVQSPALFEQAACLFGTSQGPHRGIVGLELPESFNAYFDGLDQKSLDTAWAHVRAHPFWSEFRDGRHSAAMLDLVHHLMAQSAQSKGSLRLLALARQPIDVEGARLLTDTMRSMGASRALVLIGNAHARMVRMQGQNSEPFAHNVAAAGFSVISLNAQAAGGEGWICSPECAPKPVLTQPEKGGVKIVVLPDGHSLPWHGYYYVPEMTLSRPVDGRALPQHSRLDTPSPASG
ncbi:hypothetical protein [Dyella japonica]|uniref:hypothetical protein n=1 Tax=Dyella japonica TaxID=231455 RepID=UPI001185A5B3|nr:hypothetical protein [Dyella japonica]